MWLLMFVALLVNTATETKAQTSDQVAAAIGGAVSTGVATALAINQVKENLEYQAVQYVLSEMPEYENFRLKQFSWDVRRASDLSNTSMVPFLVEPTGQDPFLLMIVTSAGWINQFGVDIKKVRFLILDREKWGRILSVYLSLAGIVTVDSYDKIPVFHKNPRKAKLEQYKASSHRVVQLDDDIFAEAHAIDMGQIESISATGISFYHYDLDKELSFPFVQIDGDSYRVADFDEELRLVFNEQSIGLFFKETKSLVQIKRRFIKQFGRALMNKSFDER